MSKSVIVDALRSPIGLKNGEMIGIRPDDLAAQVVKGLIERNPTIKTEMIEDVVLAAIKKAMENADKVADEKMKSVTGGMMPNMNIPGF